MATKEEEAARSDESTIRRGDIGAEDSGTETEGTEAEGSRNPSQFLDAKDGRGAGLPLEHAEAMLRKRRSLGDASGDISTDSEWDKVDEEGDMDR